MQKLKPKDQSGLEIMYIKNKEIFIGREDFGAKTQEPKLKKKKLKNVQKKSRFNIGNFFWDVQVCLTTLI